MLRTSLICSVFATSLLAACATDAPDIDELAGESADDGEAGKGDTVDAFTYFTVTPDLRACSLDARCGGFFVARLNRATTECGPGQTMSRCYVDSIDWDGTAMPNSVAQSYEERLRAGETLILRGDIAAGAADAGAALAATEIWVSGTTHGTSEEGVYVIARDTHRRCAVAPCQSILETRLNSNRTAYVDEVDFSVSGATNAEIARATAKLDENVIVLGYRFSPTSRTKGRTANQFYVRAPTPLH